MPTTTILIGAPLSGDEACFLRQLYADLKGTDALILANFDTAKRQIDFVVITPIYCALLELKNFPLPLFGDVNGTWTYQTAAGTRTRYQGENPWQQTKDAKFALSDEMLKFQRRNADVPPTSGRGYFRQFAAFVCIFPQIHPDSKVTRGDHRVSVASYHDVLSAIKDDSLSATWSMGEWRRFAVEHLRLTEATLEEATDPAVNEASATILSYKARINTVIGTGLPPLCALSSESAHAGEALIRCLMEPKNFFLQGPSGSAKTFHLHHLAITISTKGDEAPLILEAKKYKGGEFWTLLKRGTAPLFPGDPGTLLRAMQLCGVRPVLLIDALNETNAAFLPDLLRGAQSFVVQYGARAVFTSQTPVELPGDIQCIIKCLSLPDSIQKREIYAYHAGLAPTCELDYFCSGFTNAYDLMIAGRCHSTSSSLDSRAVLYDRYVRRFLPDYTATGSALLRLIAAGMASTLALVWSRDEFETTAERFLAEQHAPLAILDELRRSRLISLSDDYFSFEHELLFDYFKAEALRRQFTDIHSLTEELRKPRNQDLLELVLPRFLEPAELATLLTAANEADVLCRVLVGQCGPAAQSVILRQCEALLDAAIRDLPKIEVTCETSEAENGRRRFVSLDVNNARPWTNSPCLKSFPSRNVRD